MQKKKKRERKKNKILFQSPVESHRPKIKEVGMTQMRREGPVDGFAPLERG
jgi:hypothetical protein